MLKTAGFRVLTAMDGQEAIDIFSLRHQDVDGILLDMTMPYLNAEQILSEFQRINPRVQVVIMSGYTEHESMPRFADLGVVDFIQKPFNLDVLVPTVQRKCE